MVQSNTPGFSLEKIFAKLAKKNNDADPCFIMLRNKVFGDGVSDDEELKDVLLIYLSDELSNPTGMEPLILAIIRNEGLNNTILVREVFERAVALYNAKEKKAKDPIALYNAFL